VENTIHLFHFLVEKKETLILYAESHHHLIVKLQRGELWVKGKIMTCGFRGLFSGAGI
jgi:hypothetical protein